MKKYINSDNILAFLLCLIPVFDPYIIMQIAGFDIGVVDAVLGVIAVVYIWKNKGIPCVKDLFLFGLLLLAVNFLSFTTALSGSLGSSLRVWIFWAFYCVIFTAAVSWVDHIHLEKWVMRIGVAACILMLFQFTCLSMDLDVWNGRIPFLQLGKYDGWSAMVDVTGAIRTHAFFQEPSYLGIYLLPATAVALRNKKLHYALLYALCVILSTSTLAIGGLMMVFGWHVITILWKERSWKALRVYVLGIALICVIGAVAFLTVPDVRELIEYTVKKILKIFSDLSNPRMGSTRLRLIGNIFLFADYSLPNMLFGVGINQYSAVFADQIQYAYSNSVVTMILNSGLIGASAFLLLMIRWFVKSDLPNKIFPLLFMFAMFTDQMLFNWYFFYMLMWVIYGIRVSGKSVTVTHISWSGGKQLVQKGVEKAGSFFARFKREK